MCGLAARQQRRRATCAGAGRSSRGIRCAYLPAILARSRVNHWRMSDGRRLCQRYRPHHHFQAHLGCHSNSHLELLAGATRLAVNKSRAGWKPCTTFNMSNTITAKLSANTFISFRQQAAFVFRPRRQYKKFTLRRYDRRRTDEIGSQPQRHRTENRGLTEPAGQVLSMPEHRRLDGSAVYGGSHAGALPLPGYRRQ